MILPKIRDPRFTTLRRGGSLSDADHRSLALWAAECAERVLGQFEGEAPGDLRPRSAIGAARRWAAGGITMTACREAAYHANAAARPWSGGPRFAAYAAAQAAATAHVPAHYLGAAAYALKAVGAGTEEWQRQIARLPPHLRNLVLEDQRTRNPICWNVFPGDEAWPPEVRWFTEGAALADRSSSPASRTWRGDGPRGTFFLKAGPSALLSREEAMSRFFHRTGLGPGVVLWVPGPEVSYLGTEALAGTSGIAPEALARPERLARAFGEALARIHALEAAGCPFLDRRGEMLEAADRNLSAGVLASYLAPEGPAAAARRYQDLRPLADADAVIHGDYCLPNILWDDFDLQGFVDLGNGGYGDSHYDLFWGLWTLEFNLKTRRHHQAFLEAYGADRVDPDRLEFNRLLSAFLD